MHTILSIIGAGGHGRVIADMASRTGKWNLIQFFEDAPNDAKAPLPWDVAGPTTRALEGSPGNDHEIVVGIGDNTLRGTLQHKLAAVGWRIACVVDPAATISSGAIIGAGTVVMAGAVVNTGARLGTSCIINTRSVVDHDCHLGNGVHISPGATLAGQVTIGERSWIGAGAVIIPQVSIGSNTIVGAGAVVIRNMPDNVMCAGNPARIRD